MFPGSKKPLTWGRNRSKIVKTIPRPTKQVVMRVITITEINCGQPNVSIHTSNIYVIHLHTSISKIHIQGIAFSKASGEYFTVPPRVDGRNPAPVSR